jgi:hypothetical protein
VNFATGQDSTSGGGLITIIGQNFGTAGVVTVGDSLCSTFSIIPHTEIVCTLASGQGASLLVSVALAGQSCGSVCGTFSYGAPRITSVSPVVNPTAGGVTLTLSGTCLFLFM